MRRPSVLLLSAALCALGGCSTLGLDSDKPAPAPAQAAAPTADSMTPDIEGNLKQVQAMRASGDLLGATRIISQLMLVYPDDPRVVGEYGKLLVQENRSADAVQFLNRAIELSPNEWSFYSALGVAFDQQANHVDARVAYDKALQLKPGEPAVLNNYGMSRMLAGDPVMARKLFLQAKSNGLTDPKLDANLALLDKMPVPATAAPTGVASAPRPPHTAVAVDTKPLPPAHGAPAPLVQPRVVMQDVPADPLAGPVKPKPAKVARKHGDKPAKVAAAPAPVKKKKGDSIPALRMTADAGKP